MLSIYRAKQALVGYRHGHKYGVELGLRTLFQSRGCLVAVGVKVGVGSFFLSLSRLYGKGCLGSTKVYRGQFVPIRGFVGSSRFLRGFVSQAGVGVVYVERLRLHLGPSRVVYECYSFSYYYYSGVRGGQDFGCSIGYYGTSSFHAPVLLWGFVRGLFSSSFLFNFRAVGTYR